MIQDFSPSWWNKAEEEEEDNEDEEDALSGATRGLSGTTKKWMIILKSPLNIQITNGICLFKFGLLINLFIHICRVLINLLGW